MIDESTIKSLYNDRPTLLEWLKRVEEQLEEVKKLTNFDKLTANSADIKDDLKVGQTLTAKELVTHGDANFMGGTYANNLSVDNIQVGGEDVARAVYVHRIAFTIGGASRFYYRVLSTKGEPYTSISAVFADKANNSIDNVIVVDFVPTGSMGLLKFSDAGAVVDAVGIVGGNPGAFDTIGKASISFVSDEVVGRWVA